MGRRSSILAMPAAVRAQVDRWVMDGSMQYAEITEQLAELGFDVSRSAVGRYAKGLRDALGSAADYPALQNDHGALRMLLDEVRQLRGAVDGLSRVIKERYENDY